MKKGAMILVYSLALLVVLASFSTCQVPPSYPCEGTWLSPIPIVVGTPHPGTIEGGQTSYYAFVAAKSCSHTVALTHTQSDLAWKVYDQNLNDEGGCDGWYGPADEVAATLPLHEGDTYRLLVMEYELVDGTFTVTVTSP